MKLSEKISVNNKMGFHIRPLAMIAALTEAAISKIYIVKDGQSADAASIIDMLTLNCTEGSMIRIGAEDNRDSDIMNQIIVLVDNGFNEAAA